MRTVLAALLIAWPLTDACAEKCVQSGYVMNSASGRCAPVIETGGTIGSAASGAVGAKPAGKTLNGEEPGKEGDELGSDFSIQIPRFDAAGNKITDPNYQGERYFFPPNTPQGRQERGIPEKPEPVGPVLPGGPSETLPPAYQLPYEDFRDHLDSGRYEDARRQAEELKERDPESPIPYRFAALAAMRSGDVTSALDEVRQGRTIDPKDTGLLEMEHYLSARLPAMKPLDASQAKRMPEGPSPEQARLPERSGRPEGALGLGAVPVAMRDPAAPREVAEARLLKTALAEVRAGHFREADANLTRLIRKNPSAPDYYFLRAMSRRGLRDHQRALADVEQGLRLRPGDAGGLKTEALILSELRRHAEALEAIKKALAQDDRDADAYVTRARILDGMGRREEALADLETAAAIDPGAFKELYRQALGKGRAAEAPGSAPRRTPRWLLYGLPLLITSAALGYALLRPRGQTSVVERAPAEARGNSVGGFDIVGKLGQGGMGEVFEAVDRALERRVAIKKMRSEIADDPRSRRHFIKEARTVAALRHPNIIEIHAVLEEEGGLYLVFEYIAGDSLRGLVAGGPLPLKQAAELAAQIGSALDYAHAQGVIHQDLKPDNVMVEDGRAKVMDFGIARRVQDALSTMTRNEVVGTPLYMAPEQESGVVAPSVDVFALGCCLYEMLAGRPPYSGLSAKLNRAYVPAGKINPAVTPEVDAVLARALEPDPRRRFASAGELVAALRGLVQA